MDDTDALLVEQTLNGSLECFDVLMQRHERDVYRAVYGYGKSRENTMDICQNTFLKVYHNLGSFDNRSSFRTWMMRIAMNEGLNWVRSQARKVPRSTVELEPALLSSGDDQERVLLDKEQHEQVVAQLQCLNHRQRLAVTLRYFQEMSIRDIAAVLECSEGVVRNILFRSVRRLRAAVDSP